MTGEGLDVPTRNGGCCRTDPSVRPSALVGMTREREGVYRDRSKMSSGGVFVGLTGAAEIQSKAPENLDGIWETV